MGGCRCVFRDCPVGTVRNPGMHFFHFPVKNAARLQKWVEMSGFTKLLQMPVEQQKNRVVCARHFQDQCFVNYKKERLIANAVPTLCPLGEGLALDYAATPDAPRLVRLKKPTPEQKHLIPPPDYQCPIELKTEQSVTTIQLIGAPEEWREAEKRPKRAAETVVATVEAKKCKILNREAPENKICLNAIKPKSNVVALPVKADDETIQAIAEEEIANVVVQNSSSDSNEQLQQAYDELELGGETEAAEIIADCKQDVVTASEPVVDNDGKIETPPCESLEQKLRSQQLQLWLQTSKEKTKAARSKYNELLRNDQQKRKNWELQNQEQLKQYETLQAKHQALEEAFAKLQSKCDKFEAQQPKVDMVSSSGAVASLPKAAAALSKAQLFNGIKKYVSSSMAALLRMEMFSNAERPWKPDERVIAVDLLRLGEPVYEHFVDEWRFRLPALSEARAWLNDANTLDEEEDL